MDLNDCINTGTTVNGIKGKCCLSHLSFYNPVSSTCIDYMHSLLEGVAKNFFRLWFSPEYKITETCSLRKYSSEVDRRLLLIRPPSFVPTAPRSIQVWKQWRAHEYLSFIVYYALPVFNGLMTPEHFNNIVNNIVKLVIFT